jgi:hypothetical protein
MSLAELLEIRQDWAGEEVVLVLDDLLSLLSRLKGRFENEYLSLIAEISRNLKITLILTAQVSYLKNTIKLFFLSLPKNTFLFFNQIHLAKQPLYSFQEMFNQSTIYKSFRRNASLQILFYFSSDLSSIKIFADKNFDQHKVAFLHVYHENLKTGSSLHGYTVVDRRVDHAYTSKYPLRNFVAMSSASKSRQYSFVFHREKATLFELL